MTSRWRALAQTLRAAGSLRVASRWPSRCWVCGTWPSAPVCEACVADLGSPRTRCRLCALPLTRQTPTSAASQAAPHPSLLRDGHPPSLERLCLTCRTTPPPWTQCHAALDYDYPWDRCIARFKFGDQPGMARVLAELMWHAPGIAPALEQADLLVPMPLAHERLQSRGYNQAHELARELHRHLRQGPPLGARVCHLTPHVLHRLRNTDAQSALDAPTRHANLFQAFQVLPTDRRQVEGRRVVVVDDILTTGASMREATRALRQAGAHSVAAVVLARTPAVS